MEAFVGGLVVLAICLAGLFTLFKVALPASYEEGYHYGVSMVNHPEDRAEAEALLEDSDGEFAAGLRAALEDHPGGLPGDSYCDCLQGRARCTCKANLRDQE